MQISQSHIDVYKSLFRGREDVYAVRWEKDGRSGYMAIHLWNETFGTELGDASPGDNLADKLKTK